MKSIKENIGFTLTELIISLGISAVIAIIGMQYFSENLRFLNLAERKSDRITDIAHGKNFIYKDFKEAGPSYLFFDTPSATYALENSSPYCENLQADTSYNFWSLFEKETCEGVEIVLKDVGDEITFVRQAINSLVDSAIVSPEDFYDIHGTSVTFKPNKVRDVLDKAGLENKNLLKIQSVNNVQDVSENVVNFALLYSVVSKEMSLDSVAYTPVTVHCDLDKIKNLDEFFRCLPAIGLKKALVTPVNLVTYKVATIKDHEKDVRVLQRVTTNDGVNFITVNMFFNIESIRFYRENLTNSLISFEVNIPREQNSK